MKPFCKRWEFGLAVKSLVKMPVTRIGALGFESQLHSWSQLPAIVDLGRQQVMAQMVGSLPPTSETWIEFWAPSFSLHRGK